MRPVLRRWIDCATPALRHVDRGAQDTDAELVVARTQLARVWTILQRARGNEFEKSAEARWEKVLMTFEPRLHNLTAASLRGILKVPAASFQRKMIDAEREIERIRQGG